jgi:hypothetical protein
MGFGLSGFYLGLGRIIGSFLLVLVIWDFSRLLLSYFALSLTTYSALRCEMGWVGSPGWLLSSATCCLLFFPGPLQSRGSLTGLNK